MSTAEKSSLNFGGDPAPAFSQQVTDDVLVRGDVTPLSIKVAGDYYSAQVAQAAAAVENNRRQRELQDARIERAVASIDQANAQRLS